MLNFSDPWMPRNDMTVRGVGALRYPSSGNLLGKVNYHVKERFQNRDKNIA